ncbi:MAG: protein translocase subunit SecD [Myxococcales bacterium]|nr:protein translocase subunit SecD [Myxococcales bacterium]
MDRGWYARFLFVCGLAVFAVFAVWPSLSKWIGQPPQWLTDLEPNQISPGLDINGGLRLMYEVEVDEAIRDRRDLRADQLLRALGEAFGIIPEDETPTREQLSKTRERVRVSLEGEQRIHLEFKSADDAGKLDRETITRYGDLKEVSSGTTSLVLEVRPDFLERIRETAVQQARETIGNRIDELQVRQASVTAQGTDIIVEVPGAEQKDFDRIRDIISKTAKLEFKIVDDESDFVAGLSDLPEGIEKRSETVSAGEAKPRVASTFLYAEGEESRALLSDYVEALKEQGKVPAEHDLLLSQAGGDEDDPNQQTPAAWRTYLLHSRAEVTGQAVEESFVATDPQTNRPYVAVNFNSDGADTFRQLTGRNVKRRMAIVLDDNVKSAPVIQTEIGGGRCQITLGSYGGFNEIMREAQDLVLVLKAGSLPVPIRPANEQMIGPALGRDGVEQGALGAMVGVCCVLAFMLFYYQVAGVVAGLTVLLNLLFLLAAQATLGATLTLPGVTAIALNIGMAVDANVLINERIREELRNGKSPRSAIDQGFARAFWSIVDSQLTTFLAGVVLFQFGTGPIKGFAVILMIGICTSLFSGVFCSRVMFDWLARGLRVQRLRVG